MSLYPVCPPSSAPAVPLSGPHGLKGRPARRPTGGATIPNLAALLPGRMDWPACQPTADRPSRTVRRSDGPPSGPRCQVAEANIATTERTGTIGPWSSALQPGTLLPISGHAPARRSAVLMPDFANLPPQAALTYAAAGFVMLCAFLAATFALTVRRQTRRTADVLDILASATNASGLPRGGGIRDRRLRTSIDRLADRMAEFWTLATVDQLTDVLNRQSILTELEKEIGRAAPLSNRSPPGGKPSSMIATAAVELALGVGLPEREIERIRVASLLPDLGKLAIPEDILTKPGELNEPEWRIVSEHPKIGQVILEQAGALRDAATIVLDHHEWYDGRGYPHDLSGEDIPVGARIVAIADA